MKRSPSSLKQPAHTIIPLIVGFLHYVSYYDYSSSGSDRCQTILLELVKEFHALGLPFDEADSDALKDLLTNKSLGQVWLIQQKNQVIGYIILTLGYSLEYRGRDAWIDEFYIRPNYQGQGIGTKTLAFVENACHSLGVQALHLEADFKNPSAQRLYHRVGYTGHDRYLMTKWLSSH